MTQLKEILKYYNLDVVLSSNIKELDNLSENISFLEDWSVKDYKNKEDSMYLLKGKKWDDVRDFNISLHFLKLINLSIIENNGEDKKELAETLRKFSLMQAPYLYEIPTAYSAGIRLEKIERLLEGLEFSDELLIKRPFLKYLNDEGIKNFRKLYGSLPKSPYTINFLNITDDVEFLNRLPKREDDKNEVFYTTYPLEKLKLLREENFEEDYFFKPFIGEYLYERYEDDLIKFDRENKEFLKKFNAQYLPIDLGRMLKILNFCKKNEKLCMKFGNYISKALLNFFNIFFAINDDEDKLIQVLQKSFEKGYEIGKVFTEFGDTYRNAYVYDIILMLNTKLVSFKKISALADYAATSGLEDGTLKELLKGKYTTNDIIAKEAEIEKRNDEEVFKETFKMDVSEFFARKIGRTEIKEEDREKIDFLITNGYKLSTIYVALSSIDNICYLVENGYKPNQFSLDSIKQFFNKEDLDNIVKYNLDINTISEFTVYDIKEQIKKAIKKKGEVN